MSLEDTSSLQIPRGEHCTVLSHVSPLEKWVENWHLMCAEHEILYTSAVSLDIKRCTGCWAGGDFSVAVKRSWSERVMQSHRCLNVAVCVCLCIYVCKV